MIPEALNYAASFALSPAAFRPHIGSSIRLWARANRCAAAWAEHERNTKAHILDVAGRLRQRRTVVVLGSGLLRDVPITELSKLFDTVVLVDLVHLASVRAWLCFRRIRNARLICRDLSGFAELERGETPEPLAFLRQVPYLDLVVSANILSQIGVGITRQLNSAGRAAEADSVLPVLVQAHLDGLRSVGAASCLVTDISYRVVTRQGQIIEEADLLAGVAPPAPVRRWDWPVAPLGEASPETSAVHHVIAA
jgi:hypothetical protein